MPDLRAATDEITDGARGWVDQDNRAVFRSAVLQSLTLGLTVEAARAIFNNAAEAVHRDEEAENA